MRQEELFFRSLLPELVTRRWGGSHLAGEAAGLFHYTFLHSQNVGGKPNASAIPAKKKSDESGGELTVCGGHRRGADGGDSARDLPPVGAGGLGVGQRPCEPAAERLGCEQQTMGALVTETAGR